MELKHCRNLLSWNAARYNLLKWETVRFKLASRLQNALILPSCQLQVLSWCLAPHIVKLSWERNIFQCFFIIPDFAHIRDMFLLPVELMSRLKRSSLCNVFEEVGIRNIWREFIQSLMFLCQEPYKQSCGMKMRRVETTNVVHVGVNVLSTT